MLSRGHLQFGGIHPGKLSLQPRLSESFGLGFGSELGSERVRRIDACKPALWCSGSVGEAGSGIDRGEVPA